MKQLIPAESFQQLFINNIPLLDVRAPLEYRIGSFPTTTNLPLLEDAEREAIGIKYRQSGQDAAIDLGHALVGNEIREQRIRQWINFMDTHPDGLIYCFRGGLRSKIAQQWLAEAGYQVPRIAGGYKAMRRFLIETISTAGDDHEFLLIAGKTGCGKTRLLNQFENSLDLEGYAHHRGSAFGSRINSQPCQINFENALAVDLIKLPVTKYRRLVLEDESRAIGSLAIPIEFHRAMCNAPIAVVEQDITYRISTILNDYIIANYVEFNQHNPETAQENFATYLYTSLRRIKKRLGDALFDEILHDMQSAVFAHHRGDNVESHNIWIGKLLRFYYDPMYEYQLNKKIERIVFRGNSEEFISWSASIDFAGNQLQN